MHANCPWTPRPVREQTVPTNGDWGVLVSGFRRPTRGVAASAAVALLAGTAVVAMAGASSAVEGGTFTLTVVCGSDGKPSGTVTVEEHFTGLETASPNPGYQASASIMSGTATVGDSTYWYPEADGSHNDKTGANPYSSQAGYVAQPGQAFHWVLQRIYGTITTVLQGDSTI